MPDALVIPKTESIDHLKWVVDRVSAIASSRSDSAAPRALVMMCESPAGLLELPAMLRWARGREATGGGETPRLEACVFGGDDYAAGIGATR